MPITVRISAAVARLSATIAPLITTGHIEAAAQAVGLRRYLEGSNKAAKLGSLLLLLLDDRRKWGQAENIVITLTMQAHERAARSTVVMTEEHVDSVVSDMRSIGLKPGDLAHKSWRTALQKRPAMTSVPPANAPAAPEAGYSTKAMVHSAALDHVRELVLPGVNPQHRGRQLELMVLGILQVERLSPERNVVIPGEEIDLAFTLDAQHYLVECKWETASVGLPAIESFSSKVSRKAEGTFGVVLSMSGFVTDVNEKAARGARLNCIGLAPAQFMNILEGRITWGESIRRARRLASTRSVFWMA